MKFKHFWLTLAVIAFTGSMSHNTFGGTLTDMYNNLLAKVKSQSPDSESLEAIKEKLPVTQKSAHQFGLVKTTEYISAYNGRWSLSSEDIKTIAKAQNTDGMGDPLKYMPKDCKGSCKFIYVTTTNNKIPITVYGMFYKMLEHLDKTHSNIKDYVHTTSEDTWMFLPPSMSTAAELYKKLEKALQP